MKIMGVRALLVLREDVVVGLITSYDIQGSRVARFQHSANHRRREDVEVGDIMSPWEQVPVVDWRFIESAKVRDVEKVFARFNGSHVVVVEHPTEGKTLVRGVISRARLAVVRG
jgi:CBS domain-containing protein